MAMEWGVGKEKPPGKLSEKFQASTTLMDLDIMLSGRRQQSGVRGSVHLKHPQQRQKAHYWWYGPLGTETGEGLLMDKGFGGDANFLNLHCGNGCTTLSIY